MEQVYNCLIDKIKKYNPNCDFELIEKAYNVAEIAHQGQHRGSGEPYIVHPLAVANILADFELDAVSIVAGILHDTIEDTKYTIEQIETNFGKDVALLVDGVTKLERIPYNTKEEQQAENLRKMFLAMSKDIRVILIKLADRLHNMRTLKFTQKDKQIEKARETLEIYAPLAHRLGISRIKWELEDLCLRYIDSDSYYDLVEKIAKKRKERDSYINSIIETLREKIKELDIEGTVEGRPKHFYSIYRKMKEQNKTIEQIYDLFALRILVNSVHDCYAVLGLVHELYKPMPGRFKDYIAMPKPNLYQSLHTTFIGPEGLPFELQIRTFKMHKVAEVGIAAHWKYKEGSSLSGKDNIDNKLAWLRQLLEWQKDMHDAKDFMETLKIDLFADEVFVFTPRGDVLSLPASSTPIDFAYAIHSEVGNKMMGAKVNGKIVSLDYTLKNGDIIEAMTSSNVPGPRFDWLKIVKSSQARNKINQWFKKQKREENIVRGKELVEKELKKHGLTYTQIFKPEWIEIILKKYTINSLDDLYSLIGYGAITPNRVISRLKEEYKKTLKTEIIEQEINLHQQNTKDIKEKTKVSESGIIVTGVENCLVRFSRCCNPVPGDEIIGYITRLRGVSVHRKDCSNIQGELNNHERLIRVTWSSVKNATYLSEITLTAEDRAGLLMEITNIITEIKIPLKALDARTLKDQTAIINLTLEISGSDQLEKVIKKFRHLNGIIEITRNKKKKGSKA